MMLFSAQGVPPQGYYQSIWDFTSHNENSTKEAGNVVPFDFGRAAEFRAPKSIETSIAPALTPYCLKPFGGYVATISRGKVWGESGAVLTPEGKLIFDLSQEYDAKQYRMLEADEHPVFHRWNDPQLQHFAGTAAVLTFCGAHNYFHWMYDVLPRLAMLQSSGITYSTIIMNPNPYGPFVEQTWTMLGISESWVIRTNSEAYVQADQLLVPSLMMNSHYPPWTTDTLRRFLLPHRETTLVTPERFYISRKKASSRRLVNEDDVIRCLENFNIVPICLEDWTVSQQIQLFASAKVIVGPHGAGLANLAFCQPGTQVIEIFHAQHVVPTYWMISNHNNLKYYMVYGQGVPDPAIRFPGLEDIYVNVDRLKQTMHLAGLE
ncbi:glycosyltransferase family 61 protein [Paenibacillus odorifer]|uniref:glycosyltransferase family 61 protein n=2 Tax=Paenibacillus odorifer TaxID=189426 RepID=UPI0009D6DF13|nr:glycosyltransferase family 61 protein [Paenibacillus odorifer]